ncbi:hypothetical protein MSPP1_004031 [Malassezia sp. CBS 17886]|nr:hypothetical protein MSPP1_004031 [Malassezia sp. CBS 17886]
MNFLFKALFLFSLIATVALANDKKNASKASSKNNDDHVFCKCFMRVTGWNLSGDSKTVCDTLKDAHYNAETQECDITSGNKFGPGAFNDICKQHSGFSNCQMKDRQIE